MDIRIDDLKGPEIAQFIAQHLEDMRSTSPPESVHALDLGGLREPEVTFWSMWDEDQLVGTGALKQLDSRHAEIKSMRVLKERRGQGVASLFLQYIIDEARQRGYSRLSLETGSMDFFEPARKLYSKFGFEFCPPFGQYQYDPHSVFMSLKII